MADEEELPLPLPGVTGQPLPPLAANPMIPGATMPPADGQQSAGMEQLLDTLTGANAAPVSESRRIREEINELIGGSGAEGLMLGPLKEPVRFEAPPPPPPGQGFRFDPQGAQEIINEINDILETDIRNCERKAIALRRIDPPGAEYVSERMVAIANLSGEAYLAYLDSVRARLELRDQVIEARKQHLHGEADTAEGFNKG